TIHSPGRERKQRHCRRTTRETVAKGRRHGALLHLVASGSVDGDPARAWQAQAREARRKWRPQRTRERKWSCCRGPFLARPRHRHGVSPSLQRRSDETIDSRRRDKRLCELSAIGTLLR